MGSSSSVLRKPHNYGEKITHSNLINLKKVPNKVTYQRSAYNSRKLTSKNERSKSEVEILPSIQEEYDETNYKDEKRQMHHLHKRNNHQNGNYINGEFHRYGYEKVTKKIHIDFRVKNKETLLTSLVHYYKKNEQVSKRKIRKRGYEWETRYIITMNPCVDIFSETEKEIKIITEDRKIIVELDKNKELDMSAVNAYYVNFDISVKRNWKKTIITSLYNFDIQVTGTNISVILNSDSPIINGENIMDSYSR